jgi:hypothetical protein
LFVHFVRHSPSHMSGQKINRQFHCENIFSKTPFWERIF